MILNQLMRFEILGYKVPEARVRVAHSLEWWTCAQATRLSTRVPNCIFFLNWVLFNDLIFKIMDFNVFRLILSKIKIISAFSVQRGRACFKISLMSGLWQSCLCQQLANSDGRRITGIKDMPPKHLYSTTLSDYRPYFFRYRRFNECRICNSFFLPRFGLGGLEARVFVA